MANQIHDLAKANLHQHKLECGRCGVHGADILTYCEHGYRLAQAAHITGRKVTGKTAEGKQEQGHLW